MTPVLCFYFARGDMMPPMFPVGPPCSSPHTGQNLAPPVASPHFLHGASAAPLSDPNCCSTVCDVPSVSPKSLLLLPVRWMVVADFCFSAGRGGGADLKPDTDGLLSLSTMSVWCA